MRNKILELGKANIVAVLSTTSCFAPRAGDDVVQIAKLCQELEIGHVINNAYGVQVKLEQPLFLHVYVNDAPYMHSQNLNSKEW